MLSLKSLVLAGGLGLRLRPLLPSKPKVMAPVAGKPFLEHVLNSLKECSFTEIILSVGYKKELIISYFGDGSRIGAHIDYTYESKPLGTGGAIKNAQSQLNDTFLLLNGDTYLELDYNELVAFHREKNGLVTIALIEVKDSSRYGNVELDQQNRIINFEEKSAQAAKTKILINGGIYVMEPEVFSRFPREKTVSLEQEILPQMIEQHLPVFGFKTVGFFVDIGTPEGYQTAQEYFEVRGDSKK